MSEPDANGWMPIESAPKDGTWFLGYRPSSFFEDRVDTWHWDRCAGEQACGMWINAADSIFDEQPTHWQPLPKPPVSDASK